MSGEYVFEISKEGFDVKTCADKDLVFSSRFDSFRVYDEDVGSVTLDGASAQDILLLTHSLAYRPAFFFYSEIHTDWGGATGNFFMCPFTFAIGGDNGIIPYVTDTEFRVRYGGQHVPGSYTLSYKWAVLYNPAK